MPYSRQFRALRHRNFRLFLGGQLVSLSGTWMQQVALGWLVYRLTESPFLLGLVGFCGQFPSLLAAPFAGVWADRMSRQRLVIGTQAAGMLQAFALAALVLTDTVTISHVLVLSLVMGLINGVDVPARQAFFVEMIDEREDLANAIALNSSTFNASRLVGPSVAGVLIGAVGEGVVFLLNGFSYLAVIAALLAMRVAPRTRREAPTPVLTNLKEGMRYAFGFAPIRALIVLVAGVSFFGVPITVLLPVVATEILGGGPQTLGFLVGAMGLGALTGALYLAGRPTVRGLGTVIRRAAFTFGASLLAVAAAPNTPFAVTAAFCAGAGVMIMMASVNTVLQTILEEDKRGRVMSLYAMAFLGMNPLGALAAGSIASHLGTPLTIALGGAGTLVAAWRFGRALPVVRDQIRPIYERLGIPDSKLPRPPLVG